MNNYFLSIMTIRCKLHVFVLKEWIKFIYLILEFKLKVAWKISFAIESWPNKPDCANKSYVLLNFQTNFGVFTLNIACCKIYLILGLKETY